MFVIFYVLFCMIAGLLGVALGYWVRKKEDEPIIEAYKENYKRLKYSHDYYGKMEKSE